MTNGVIVALALCCLWPGMPANVSGQATGQLHQHEQTTAKESTPQEQGSAKLSIPDVMLLDQDGNQVRFYTDLIKGKVVLINFVFTSCTVVCPPLGSNFAKVQTMLGERFGKDVHLISISTDPETDTSARLRAWGAKFGARPGWTLVTGERARVDQVLLALTGDTTRVGAHSPIVIIGNDARGEWVQAYGLAAPNRLLKLIDDLNQ